MIAGVLTANELNLLRTRPQRTQLYLAIPAYHTLYTARVNNAPASNDNVRNIEYDGGAATPGHTINDVVMNMTVLIGSTAGAFDIGMARMRSTILDLGGNTGLLPIGSTSELSLANDQYLTIIDDFSLWPRHPFISIAGVMDMDFDTTYTNENVYGDPVPIAGMHAVLELTGASVSVNFDASDSYTCIGTPDHYDYAWYVDGALVSNAASVNISFASVGTYLIKLEVTADYAIGSPVIEKTSASYRYVIVHNKANPLNSSFVLESCSGSYDEGGWSYRVTMNAKASEAYVRDRTLCLLVARDWYGDTEQSIGPLDGRENIVCVGWVDGESIHRSNDKSMVSFDVQGPTFWLGVQEGFPTGIDDTNAAPTDWSHVEQLDPRKGLFSFLHWRTTSTAVMDCYITSDDHRLATTYTPAGSLLEQLRAIAERVNAKTCCDRYGRLFCEIDTQFIDPALRVPPTFPVVQTFTDRDWRNEITIERRTVGQAGQVDLSGVYYSGDLATSNAIFSLSPGHIPSHYGEKRKVERIALDDQTEANLLAGLWHGYYNNEFPNIDTPLSSNHRAIDIAPRMFAQMNLAASDTPRGIVWTNKKLIPREVTFNYDAREALLLTDITFEAEAFASDAVTGDPPIEPPDPPDPPAPPILCNDPLALNFGGLAPCIYPTESNLVIAMNDVQVGYSTDFYTEASPTWHDASGNLALDASHRIYNIVVCPGGDAYCLTHSGTPGACGAWYCADITASPPVWSLVVSETQLMADVGPTPMLPDPVFHALTVDGSGVVWTKPTHQNAGTKHYFYHGSGGALTLDNIVIAPLTHDGEGQFSITYDCSNGVFAGFSRNVDNGGHYMDLDSGAFEKYATAGFRGIYTTSPNYVIGNTFWGTAGTVGAMGAIDVAIYTNVQSTTPLFEAGGSLYYLDNTTHNMMVDGGLLAVDSGASGVFSLTAGAVGSAFHVSGLDILWVTRTAADVNRIMSIAYSEDGGATWQSKDGNWSVEMGAAWAGTSTLALEAIIKSYTI